MTKRKPEAAAIMAGYQMREARENEMAIYLDVRQKLDGELALLGAEYRNPYLWHLLGWLRLRIGDAHTVAARAYAANEARLALDVAARNDAASARCELAEANDETVGTLSGPL